MDKIRINGLSFYGHHGLLSEENKLGQRYITSLTIELDVQPAAENDDIRQTIDYRKALAIVEKIVTGPPCKLIETVAERIANRLLDQFPAARAVTAQVTKPHPPMPFDFDGVSVEVRRERG